MYLHQRIVLVDILLFIRYFIKMTKQQPIAHSLSRLREKGARNSGTVSCLRHTTQTRRLLDSGPTEASKLRCFKPNELSGFNTTGTGLSPLYQLRNIDRFSLRARLRR